MAALSSGLTAFTALAQPATWDASIGLGHRRLVERDAGGATLLSERGPLLHGRLAVTQPQPDGRAWQLLGHAATGDLDYDGRTQAGVPLQSRTRHVEGGVDLWWRPAAPAAWGEAWVGLGWLGQHRGIRSTPAASGLEETSSAWMGGVRWRSPAREAAGWQLALEAEGRVSLRHRLEVDFLGVLDPVRFEAARKRQLVLRLSATRPGSGWEAGLELARQWQGESGLATVAAGGVPVGTVRQPQLSVRDVALRLTRRF